METRNYIDGRWHNALSGDVRSVINPATNLVIAEVADSSEADAKLAIQAAKRSFYQTRTWRDTTAQVRADILLKIQQKILSNQTYLATLETKNNGKPLREAEADIEDAAYCFSYYAGLIRTPYGGVYDVNDNFGNMHSYTVHEPIGVCGLIAPWNFPFVMAAWKLAPAIAAGNSVIFKPSPETPLSVIELFKIFDEVGLPNGVANLVLGDGVRVGNELASSMDVDLISFTGSTEVGRTVSKAAVANLKRVSLELGGKSPIIIFADADLEGAVEWAMLGIFFNQGEVCTSGSRIIVEASIEETFVERFVERTKQMTIGNGLTNPDIGPLISINHMNKVLDYIAIGKEEGARLVCGGERYQQKACAEGFYILPTIFVDCKSDMRIVKEEIFGPVVTIQTFETETEAISLANDTDYGLAGGVFTTDGARGLRVIKELRAGITWINAYNPVYTEAPWGGYKQSGNGRELGVQGLSEYQEIKQVNINLAPGPVDWYRKRG